MLVEGVQHQMCSLVLAEFITPHKGHDARLDHRVAL